MIMNKKGFTLIEMVVSVFMITIAVVGIVQLTTKYIQTTKFEKESYTAALLGQEGIEIIKNIRDTNWVEGAATWNDGLSTDGDYEADYNDSSLSSYDSTHYLYVDGSGYYNYSSGTKTIYRRKITLANSSDKVSITVTMYWRTNELSVKQDIYNWKP
ncbi:MAG: hypothetical protein MCSN_6410 [Candidatus Microsyncoccus archaeolyticus]|nr:MAG: hypothetical protein MCSN_6410 [Candidatus Parcubacteria bacterium]